MSDRLNKWVEEYFVPGRDLKGEEYERMLCLISMLTPIEKVFGTHYTAETYYVGDKKIEVTTLSSVHSTEIIITERNI